MRLVFLVTSSLIVSVPARAQGVEPWQMHDWMHRSWGGMGLGFLFMIAVLALVIAVIVGFVRWIDDGGGRSERRRTPRARDILDERYARGEIDREEYLRRRSDIDAQST
jgi:putative membrane protein